MTPISSQNITMPDATNHLAGSRLPVEAFITRRKKLLAKMPDNSLAIFSAASEVARSNDTEYGFCQNKNFYYLTGFNEPDAILVLVKHSQSDGQSHSEQILFSLPKDPLQEIWHGRRIGQQQAEQSYAFDRCFTLDEIDQQLPLLLNQKSQVLFCFNESEALNRRVFSWLAKVKATIRQGGKVPVNLLDVTPMIDDLRLIKSEAEIVLMRAVNHISGLAHQRAMAKTQVGKFEYQIEADILHEFARHGARDAAYASIVAGGDNANILHYTNNNDVLKGGDLLLIDAGGELSGYAADITRTFPINGKFSVEQKAIYQLVLDAQLAAITAIKVGNNFAQLNDIANECLTKGLVELGILSGELKTLLAEKACKKYFIHGLGHWLGLDVHDVGDYHINDDKQQLRTFEVGMVMTIEPGLYFPADDDSVAEKWRGIGVRIEDNILVTDQGHENLTQNAPKSIIEIEQLMNC